MGGSFQTVFFRIVSVYNASVLGLVTLLTNMFSDDGICLSIFASLATDGASVMTGRYNGVAVQLVQAWIFFMLVCHCVAHRHSLACEDAASENESAVYLENSIHEVINYH